MNDKAVKGRVGWMMVLCFICVGAYAVPPGLILSKVVYEKSVATHSGKQLVDLSSIPHIVLDIRYATRHNFTGQVIYPFPAAWARRVVYDSLLKAQATFVKMGYAIKIYDAYRPYRASVALWKAYPNKVFVAPPNKGSRHNRGCALDLTLVSLKTGKELPMPTAFDHFSKQAFPSAVLKDEVRRKNRDMLIRVLADYGFKVSRSEWWHFDFQGWQQYELLDIPFTDLMQIKK